MAGNLSMTRRGYCLSNYKLVPMQRKGKIQKRKKEI